MLPSLLSLRKKKEEQQKIRSSENEIPSNSSTVNDNSPEENLLIETLREAFIINHPVQSGGGDGYWTKKIEDKPIFIVFDCSGVGRLASIISRMYTEVIEEAVKRIDVLEPSEILTYIHEKFEQEFKDDQNSQVQKAADMAVIVVDEKNQTLLYSGAKMDLFKLDEGKVKIFKSCQQQLGANFDVEREYETKIVPYDEQSKFYLFTDGITELKGGQSGEPLGIKNLGKMIVECKNLDLANEQSCLTEKLSKWLGDGTQEDDLLLIGFKPGKA